MFHPPPPIIEPTPNDQRRQALLLMQLDDAHVDRLLAAAHAGEIDMDGLFHARRDDILVGAAWGQLTPGRTAFCWPAKIVGGEEESAAERLQNAVNQYLDRSSVVLSQAILSPRDNASAVRLTRAGYQHLADLEYLVSSVQVLPDYQPCPDLSFIGSHRQNATERVRALVERTYQQTLDCANLDRVQSIDEVLDGYRRTGVFRPAWWIVAQHHGRDAGCLLLADYPEHDQTELMYMGLIPELRGRGWGFELARHAQWIAHTTGRNRLVLAVDDTNWPARDQYKQAGFETWDRRSVYVRTLRPKGKNTPSAPERA